MTVSVIAVSLIAVRLETACLIAVSLTATGQIAASLIAVKLEAACLIAEE
jgi:hypothetical protein